MTDADRSRPEVEECVAREARIRTAATLSESAKWGCGCLLTLVLLPPGAILMLVGVGWLGEWLQDATGMDAAPALMLALMLVSGAVWLLTLNPSIWRRLWFAVRDTVRDTVRDARRGGS